MNVTTEGVAPPAVKPLVGRLRLPSIDGVWYLLVVLLAIGFAVNPSFAAPKNLNSILVAGAPAILLALG
ncbi:MAG: hypothetical protein ACRDUX_13715, partial [Mycobacterium sp.]